LRSIVGGHGPLRKAGQYSKHVSYICNNPVPPCQKEGDLVMTSTDLSGQAETLQASLEEALPAERLKMQPELARVIRDMKANGIPVSRRLRQLEAALTEEVIEAGFDNMPV